jgi:hypothetical protein
VVQPLPRVLVYPPRLYTRSQKLKIDKSA